MAYDLEEQERAESLKAWWRQYGNALTWLVIAGLLVFCWLERLEVLAAQASAAGRPCSMNRC